MANSASGNPADDGLSPDHGAPSAEDGVPSAQDGLPHTENDVPIMQDGVPSDNINQGAGVARTRDVSGDSDMRAADDSSLSSFVQLARTVGLS